MTWALAISLIEKYGIPLVIWLASKKPDDIPTPAEWDELAKLAQYTAGDSLQSALAAAGIPLDSPQAVALLALIPKPPA
jgi:hypothetical protein